jgi:hypothetical protein
LGSSTCGWELDVGGCDDVLHRTDVVLHGVDPHGDAVAGEEGVARDLGAARRVGNRNAVPAHCPRQR